jgi:small subunit ribosomal protein S16
VVKWEHGNNPKKGLPGEKAKERVEEKAKREADRLAAIEEAKNRPAPSRSRWLKKSPPRRPPLRSSGRGRSTGC